MRDKLSMEQRAKFKRGTDVGILAQQLFPGGINMTPGSPTQFSKKAAETLKNLTNPAINVMYEAVFQYDDTLIMLDIIVRDGDKWRAIEVKSSLSISQTYMKDAALQYYVLKGCEVPLSDIQLMYINADYVKNGDLDLSQLFVFQSVKDYAEQYQDVIAKNIAHFKDIIKQPHSPKIPIGDQCDTPYRCEFHGHCWKDVSNEANKPYTIDYKPFYELLGDRNQSTAYLNLLFYRPAVPLFDGDKPYTEFIIGFSILSNNGNFDKIYNWDCLEDLSKWQECLPILSEQLSGFERVVCFAPQNITASLQKYNLLESKELNYKIFNLREVLQQSDFHHEKVKTDFSLKNVYESIFPDKNLFEHSRIILNALSDNIMERSMITSDLELENKALREIYLHFAH
ncbi:MAG: hypothetical protein J6P64_09355 [Bacteroidales bacterium]|nr:hypothetical protein [Bacteroidales bacterium]